MTKINPNLRLGIIVHDNGMIMRDADFYVGARHMNAVFIRSLDEINADNLKSLADCDVVAYSDIPAVCREGEDAINAKVAAATGVPHVTNPVSAIKAAFSYIRKTSLDGSNEEGNYAHFSCDPEDAVQELESCLAKDGFTPILRCHFDTEKIEKRHSPSLPDRIVQEVIPLVPAIAFEAALISCTHLYYSEILFDLEKKVLPRYIISCNQALLWHMILLTGNTLPKGVQYGRLFYDYREGIQMKHPALQ